MKRHFKDYKEVMRPIFERALDGKRGIRTNDTDRCTAIMGYEGTGKSNLGLLLFELWYEVIGKKLTVEEIKFICANGEMLGHAVNEALRLQMIDIDEGALISYSRQGMHESNVMINQMLMTIRGEGFHFLINIPHVLDLDSYIRKNRLSSLIVCLPGYEFAYYSRKRLRQLLPKLAMLAKNNQYPDVRQVNVQPNFTASFPKYTGILKEKYLERKQEGMRKMRDMVFEQFTKKKEKTKELTEIQKKVHEYRNEGLTQKETAKRLGLHKATIAAHERAAKKKGAIFSQNHYYNSDVERLSRENDGFIQT